MSSQTRTVRLKVSAEVARIAAPGASRELRLEAARGDLPLACRDLVSALFFLGHGADPEIRTTALATFRRLPVAVLMEAAAGDDIHPQILDFIIRQRTDEPAIIDVLLDHPALALATLLHLAGHAGGEVLSRLAEREDLRRLPGMTEALLVNPRLAPALRARLQGGGHSEAAPEDDGRRAEEEGDENEEEIVEEELNLSKYQQSMEMGVSEKIKMALTGDKEWRNIFLKDPNKLVSSAVLKNPRVTEGEVLAVAKNKSSSDELIRLILLNREWEKNYGIKKALIMHPRTPLPKALRFMGVLTEKDVKQLAKSRNVSQVIVSNARRMLMAKQKKS